MSQPTNLTRQQWRRLGVAVYLPTTLSYIGISAVVPLLALTAHDLGASTAEAAVILALMSVGGLVGALPAGIVAARFGERKALVGSLVVDAALMVVAALATSVWVLGAAVFGLGLSGAVVLIARQVFLTEFVPFRYRARALSTLGGVFRIGFLLGPLSGAAVVSSLGLRAAYWFAVVMILLAAAVSALLPDLPDRDAGGVSTSTLSVMSRHRRALLTVGVGAAALMLVRASRDSLLPLWAAHIGLDAAQTSLLFAASSAIDLTLFYLGGSIMDRWGRRAVAVPAMVIMGTVFGLIPLTSSMVGLTLAAIGLGLGNGISSGVVMTLGSDASPAVGRHQFLGAWRLTTGVGQALGPLAIAAITAVAPLAWACLTVAALGWAGGAWLWHHGSPQKLAAFGDDRASS
ncbi:MFS transporter [Aestuariimicrobium ganziense]|uniref:MFS transporter n=1 Tax=Aestuariimicrobium ganziense TaxID=2773677 RepID=UPI002E2D619A|nr:MFS transporter [Aestuariimicrobium ganziense]